MVLAKIQSNLDAYRQWLSTVKHHPFVYPWESVRHFQEHWNLDVQDPAAMYGGSFHNTETRRLWQTENWEPRRVMQEFWRFDPLTVRLMFDDLFQEAREVEGRIGRFVFGCDSLLRDYKKANPASVENNHYHGDYRMIANYLAFRYPESYAVYDFEMFQGALARLGARDVPQQHDLPRYFKVLRTLMTFIDKDPEVEAAMKQHLHPKRHYQGKTMLLAWDYCRFVAAG